MQSNNKQTQNHHREFVNSYKEMAAWFVVALSPFQCGGFMSSQRTLTRPSKRTVDGAGAPGYSLHGRRVREAKVKLWKTPDTCSLQTSSETF